jgi:hypothetical protein
MYVRAFAYATVLILGAISAPQAATLTVMNLNDAGAGSLRDVIANASSGDMIVFQTSPDGGTLKLNSTLNVTVPVTIQGPNNASIAISGQNSVQIMTVSADLTISGLTFTAGNTAGDGGGIYLTGGTLTVTGSTFSGNTASNGGGIYQTAGTTLTVTNSTFSGNTASSGNAAGDGGGIYQTDGTLTVTGSTFSGNTAANGGGIYQTAGTLTVTNSTVAASMASNDGGGIYNLGTVTVTNSTFVNNSAVSGGGAANVQPGGTLTLIDDTFSANQSSSGLGGALSNLGSFSAVNTTFSFNQATAGAAIATGNTSLTVENSVFADNAATGGPGAFSPRPPGGTTSNNVFFNNTANGVADDGNGYGTANFVVASAEPLMPLGNYGGPTETQVAVNGGATICAGSVALIPQGTTTDQRGLPRTVLYGATPCVDAGATQTPAPGSFTVQVGTVGSGTVTSSPAGINCGSSCAMAFRYGEQITLTATPATGSMFAGWSGGGCAGTGTCVITPSANTTVTATFTLIPPVTLTVAEVGTGTGQVTSSPSGINCSASSNQCAAPFAVGTQVTLIASASAGSAFAGWSGSGCGGTSPCVVTMSAAQSVTATFNVIPSFMLSVVPSGTGSGTVTSTPSGIDCGATCNASFQTGTPVTLSAVAASGSTFAGWSGGGCSGDQSCSVMLSANTAVNASFVQNSTTSIALEAAVLPLSRSVEVGATATAFAAMLDAGPADASTCTIAPATNIPASFVFQTTDPRTNALTGTANTPVNILQGADEVQTFVIAFTPSAAFAPINVLLTFACANANAAPQTVGVDILNLSASATAVPDIVALAASGDPGYVDIPGATGIGVFAVATINLGIDTTITASANTGTANLPVGLTVCQTNSTTGICMARPAPSVTTDIQPNATPTFGIFVTGSATVANLPGVNRVFVTFTDSGGVLRGETSVAVRTQ